jgi:glycosyltransferase involved in cell wall biosynthesis
MRILTHRGHCAHQYELWKLPHQFTCVTGIGSFSDAWVNRIRPLHSNVSFVNKDLINIKDYDIAIVHIDEFCIDSPHSILVDMGWHTRFEYFMSLDIPKVFLIHGTPRMDEDEESNTRKIAIDKIKKTLDNYLVVCNSEQQRLDWGFNKSKTIYHGFDEKEFKKTSLIDNFFYINPSTEGSRPIINGKYLKDEVISLCGEKTFEQPSIMPSFPHYLRHLSTRTFFFNFTRYSPMPRNRGESLMCGNIVISTPYYNWSDFIKNGVDGFICSSSVDFYNTIKYIKTLPKEEIRKISNAARKKATEVFSLKRYLSDWEKILNYNM